MTKSGDCVASQKCQALRSTLSALPYCSTRPYSGSLVRSLSSTNGWLANAIWRCGCFSSSALSLFYCLGVALVTPRSTPGPPVLA
jgi:hypothetical protein